MDVYVSSSWDGVAIMSASLQMNDNGIWEVVEFTPSADLVAAAEIGDIL